MDVKQHYRDGFCLIPSDKISFCSSGLSSSRKKNITFWVIHKSKELHYCLKKKKNVNNVPWHKNSIYKIRVDFGIHHKKKKKCIYDITQNLHKKYWLKYEFEPVYWCFCVWIGANSCIHEEIAALRGIHAFDIKCSTKLKSISEIWGSLTGFSSSSVGFSESSGLGLCMPVKLIPTRVRIPNKKGLLQWSWKQITL